MGGNDISLIYTMIYTKHKVKSVVYQKSELPNYMKFETVRKFCMHSEFYLSQNDVEV